MVPQIYSDVTLEIKCSYPHWKVVGQNGSERDGEDVKLILQNIYSAALDRQREKRHK